MSRVTNKQRKLAEKIVENAALDRPLNRAELLESVGYSENTAIGKPREIFDGEGVQIALAEMGFTEANAKNVVAEILLNSDADDGHRLKAASEVFKVKGSYAAEKINSLQVNVEARISGDSQLEALDRDYEEKVRLLYASRKPK